MLLGNTLALFINLLSPGGDSGDRSSAMGSASKTKSQSTSKAARKYPNAFLDNGRFFTWFVDSSRMRTLLYRKDSFPLTTGTGSNTREGGENQVFLFVRQKRGQYIHCGRCKLIHSEPSYSSSSPSPQRSGMTKLLFELVDYYNNKSNTTTHTSTGVNDYTTTAATTKTPDNWNDLQSSPLYSNAISTHIEELHCGTGSTS